MVCSGGGKASGMRSSQIGRRPRVRSAEVVVAILLPQGGLQQLASGSVRQLRNSECSVRDGQFRDTATVEGKKPSRIELAVGLGYHKQQRSLAPARMPGSDDRSL